jgi:hypothetical protein
VPPVAWSLVLKMELAEIRREQTGEMWERSV